MNDPVIITAVCSSIVFLFFMVTIRDFYRERTAKNLSWVLWLGFCFVNIFTCHILVLINTYLMGERG